MRNRMRKRVVFQRKKMAREALAEREGGRATHRDEDVDEFADRGRQGYACSCVPQREKHIERDGWMERSDKKTGQT